MRKVRLRKQKKSPDKKLLVLTLALTAFGLVALADASAPAALISFSDKFYFVKQQAVWGALGIGLMFLFSKIHYSFWQKFAVPFFIVSIFLLILVLVPQIGVKALGARRWIVFGPISFQPSELAKLALAVYIAKVASKDKKTLSYFFPLFLVASLVMFQPDLGTTIVIMAEGFAQIFISGVSFVYLFGAVLAGGAASLILILTSEYRKDRLITFLEQTQDPLDKAYHLRQVLLALGAGGLFGVGLGQSRQKFLFLPEAATDSIFAVVAEEVGFLGASLLIVLFAFFVFRGIRIVVNSPDKFSQVLATGIVAWVGGQAFLNISAMVALVPLTGIPLPFFSYGGSSLTTVLMATGILLNISRNAPRPK